MGLLVLAGSPSAAAASAAPTTMPHGQGTYADLLKLNEELQGYMLPSFTSGVVMESGARVGGSYADAAMAAKLSGLADFERRLGSMNVAGWSASEQVDWLAVTSMLNGYRFNLEVLRPWKRDPGFYLDPLLKVAFTCATPRVTPLRSFFFGAALPAGAFIDSDIAQSSFADQRDYALPAVECRTRNAECRTEFVLTSAFLVLR